MNSELLYEIGIDIGGTFTDVVCRAPDGSLRQVKIPTTRANPADAVRDAITHAETVWGVPAGHIARFVHGTTVATNAVLERKGARVGLLATQGFRDVLEIGRQSRREIYDTVLKPQTPAFLAPRAMRRDVPERITFQGEVITALDEAALLRAVDELVALGAEAIAVAFLFSFLDPRHEHRARELILARHPQLYVSLSCEVDPAFREYERTCATAFDAYVKPVLDRYLAGMEAHLRGAGVPAVLAVMQSRGGICGANVARQRPVRLFLSGPAAGAIGGTLAGRAAGEHNLITVDIGGTSCDIALIDAGAPLIRTEGLIDGYPVRVPMVDVNAIGAGGGSVAWLDGSGALRVGPHSAGAEPGPACYGRGAEAPTVTDASVALGYLNPGYFAGGTLKLDARLAVEAIDRHIAQPMKLSVAAAALGIHRVVNAQMAEGIRLVSIRRGYDPRRFALVALGGAGPLHACALAEELSIAKIVVPRRPGVLSAIGLLAAPVEHEAFIACGQRFEEAELGAVRTHVAALDAQCAALMRDDGAACGDIRIEYSADVCFVGQSYSVTVGLPDTGNADCLAHLYDAFVIEHERIYGHATRNPARIVNLRSVHRAGGRPDLAEPAARGATASTPKGHREVLFAGQAASVPVALYDRDTIGPDLRIFGPAIIEQADTTTLVGPGWCAQATPGGDLIITHP